jgi:hypothetical protein
MVLEIFEYGPRCVLGLDRRVREECDYARKELLARADFSGFPAGCQAS